MIEFDRNRKKVAGIGAPLIDLLVLESDEFVLDICDAKGGMTLVDDSFIDSVLEKTGQKPSIVPGGAACNTIIGLGNLGAEALFIGKKGDDAYGELFGKDLLKNNVTPGLIKSSSSTGRVLSVITPDTQRTMFTNLGASVEFGPDEIREDMFEDAAIVYIEAYLLSNSPTPVPKIVEAAKKNGALAAMDLASFQIVEAYRDFLYENILEHIDILIANEDEARVLTGHSDEQKALEALERHAKIAVLKVGERGSYISCDGRVTKIAAKRGDGVVDTTGAGDLWASGFLYGVLNGFEPEKCGELASLCGYEVCRVTGADIPEDGWERIRAAL